MVVDPRRDHSMRVPRPDQSVSLGVPNACSDCHREDDAAWAAARVREWLGRDASGFETFASTFAAADAGDPRVTTGSRTLRPTRRNRRSCGPRRSPGWA